MDLNIIPPDYHSCTVFREYSRFTLLSATGRNDLPVIIKTTGSYPTEADRSSLKREMETALKINAPGTIRILRLEEYRNGLFLVMEGGDYTILADEITARKPSLEKSLSIASALASSLGFIHETNHLFGQVNPSNVLINKATGDLILFNFALAENFMKPGEMQTATDLPPEALPYMSPEQTGRMNRLIDHRTDLYSLGVTMYLLVTGRLPFDISDPLELAYCHMTINPIAPVEVDSSIPDVISSIIMKLIAKNPEDRYCSTFGVRCDIDRCLSSIKHTGRIESFVPAEKDRPIRLSPPSLLFGRERERRMLFETIAAASERPPSILSINGIPGSGKTTLIRDAITRSGGKGCFVEAGFTRISSQTPYDALIAGLQNMVRRILIDIPDAAGQWKDELTKIFRGTGTRIHTLIPDLKLFFDEEKETTQVGITEGGNLFIMALTEFLHFLAMKLPPLIVFLDDCHYADAPTLQLMERVITTTRHRGLLVIISADAETIAADNPLNAFMNNMLSRNIPISRLDVHPLGIPDIDRFLIEATGSPPGEVTPLSPLLKEKTDGNPFFMIEFINMIQEKGLLKFDSTRGTWKWDEEKIRESAVTENMITILSERIRSLTEGERYLMAAASCAGGSFTADYIAKLLNRDVDEVTREIRYILHRGLLVSDTNGPSDDIQIFSFPDERVRDAIRSVVSENEMNFLHLRAGRILQEIDPGAMRTEKIYEIANHFNTALPLVDDEEEKRYIIELNIRAAERAKLATAYAYALHFLYYAERCMSGDPWQKDYETAFTLYREMAECEYLAGNRNRAEELFEYTERNAVSLHDKGEIYIIWITHLANSGRFQENLRVGSQALELFGIKLPPLENETLLTEEFNRDLAIHKRIMADRKADDLKNLQEVRDPSVRISLRILTNMLSSAYVSKTLYLAAAGVKAVNLTLTGGVCPEATFPIPVWGLVLNAVFKDYRTGYDFGMLGLHYLDKYNHPANRSNSLFVLGNFINHWRHHIRHSIDYCSRSFQAGKETGDFVYAAFAATSIPRYYISYGHDALDQVLLETEKTMSFFMKSGNSASLERQKLMMAVIHALQGKSTSTDSLSSSSFDEEHHIREMELIHYGTGISLYYHYRMMVLYLYRHIPQALEMAGKAMEYITFVAASIQEADTVFYHSMCLCAIHEPGTSVPPETMKVIEEALEKINNWRDNCPENFHSMLLLLRGEYMRILDRPGDALDLYDEAIEASIDDGFFSRAALAGELAARMLVKIRKPRRALTYLADALYYYRRWGALGKTRQIEQEFADILSSSHAIHVLDSGRAVSDSETYHESLSGTIDLMTIINASRQISGEMVLGNLIDHLMTIVMKNTGSQRGALVLEKNGILMVYILREGNVESITPAEPVNLETVNDLPHSMIHFSLRSGDPVILGDAARDSSFSSDDYISRAGIHSVIVMPVMQQKQTIGVLYLENGPVINSYSSDRIEILKLLTSQIAISLKNAMTFEELTLTRESLKINEEKYRLLFNNLQDLYYRTDAEGRLTLVSPSVYKILGYTPDEMTKINVSAFYVNSRDRETFLSVMKEKGIVEDYEVQLRRKDGKTVWVATNTHAITDHSGGFTGVEGMIRDISERKNAESQVKEEKERLSVTLRNISDGVITTGRDGKPVLLNRVAEKIIESFHGDPSRDSFEQFLQSMVTAKKRNLQTILAAMLNDKKYDSNDTVFYPEGTGGSGKIFEISMSPIRDQESTITGSIIVLRDITEKNRMEQEMLKVQKLESLGIFAGGIAHDFNNILTGILGNVSLARRQCKDDDPLSRRLADMETAAIRARDLTRQLLTFSKGGNPVTKVQSVAKIIREASGFVLSGSTTRCILDLPDDPLAAEVDEGQISQVFHNILINAMQAMENGGTVLVTGRHVMLEAGSPIPLPPGRYIEISFRDEGTGIPRELLLKIFDPFFTTKSKGNGLGLTTTYSIVQKHRGYITVESQVNHGTTFHVYLPASTIPVVFGVPLEESRTCSDGGTILLMDDEEIVLNVGSEILKNLGYSVDTARSGNEAIDMYIDAMRKGIPYKLVIMDLTIPEHMGGREAIGKLIEIDPDVRAIVSSGYSNDPVMMEHRKHGFRGIIRKPYRVDEMREVIQDVLGNK